MTPAQPPRRSASTPDDDATADAALTRVQAPRGAPRLAAAMWLLAAFVVVAVLKPWGGGGPVAATLRPDVVVPVEITPVPTRDRSATGLAVDVCLGAGGWRVASLETWRDRDVRVWRAIEPVANVTGLDDPTIPSVPIVADKLTGLGFCAPAFGPDMPIGPAHVAAYHVLSPTVMNTIPLRQVQPVDGATPIAALYVPRFEPWTTGRVVFQYEDAGAGTWRWFAADLQILAPVPAPSAPSAAPAALPAVLAP
jgi:hypothetical protein